MEELLDFRIWLIGFIEAGCAVRIVLCLIGMGMSPEKADNYKTKAKNALLFAVIAPITIEAMKLLFSYFG